MCAVITSFGTIQKLALLLVICCQIHTCTYILYIPGLHLGGAFCPPWLDFAPPPPLEFMSTNNYNHCDHQPKQLLSYSSYSTRLTRNASLYSSNRNKLMLASVLKFGNIVFNISFEVSSFNCNFMLSWGCLAMNWRKVFHSGKALLSLTVFLLCYVSAECARSVLRVFSPWEAKSLESKFATFFGLKMQTQCFQKMLSFRKTDKWLSYLFLEQLDICLSNFCSSYSFKVLAAIQMF